METTTTNTGDSPTTEPVELTPEQQARQDAENAVMNAAHAVTVAAYRLKETANNIAKIAYSISFGVDETNISMFCDALTGLAHKLRHDPPNLADRIDDLTATLNTLETTINHKGA